MNKILSISIAAYNVGDVLSRTIDSILKCQLKESIQIIVVNDGSKDSTIQVAESYQEKFPSIVTVIDKKNGGYGSTINASIKVATGKYYRLLDGDDEFISENLDKYISFLERVDSDIVVSPYYRYYFEEEKMDLIDRHDIPKVVPIKELNSVLDIQNPELCYRTSLLRSNPIEISEHIFYTDNEFVFIPLIYSETIVKFSDPIYKYWIGGNDQSVSINGRIKHYKDSELVEKKLIKSYSDNIDLIAQDFYKKTSLQKMLYNLANYQFANYLLLDKPNRKEIIEFDEYIKCNNPELYLDLSQNSKRVKMLRKMKFHFLPTFHKMMRKVVENEQFNG